MPVMQVVDVIPMGDGDVSAPFPVVVSVCGVLGMALAGALVEVPVVGSVKVPVVDVVDMLAMRNGDMPAAVPMNMRVSGVLEVGGRHGCTSWECRMASLTM